MSVLNISKRKRNPSDFLVMVKLNIVNYGAVGKCCSSRKHGMTTYDLFSFNFSF